MGLDTTNLTIDQALHLWRRAVVESVRRETPDLSARQMAVLLTVYLTPAPHTVRGLAATLKISKPAITRALDRLGDYGLLKREVDEADRRSVLVQRTEAGQAFLGHFGELVVHAAETAMLPRHDAASLPSLEVA